MRLALALTGNLSLGSGAAFDPASLFTTEEGGWYDPSDLSTLWQDSARTTPVTAHGDPVGAIDDKSGNGNHLTQATADSRPLYQSDASGDYLLFDVTNDHLLASFNSAQPWDRISALRVVTWTLNRTIFTSPTGVGIVQMRTSSPELHLVGDLVGPSTSDLAVGTNGVLTERHNGASSRVAVDNNAYATGNVGTATANTGLTVPNASGCNIRLYGLLQIARALTDSEIASLRSFMADKAGVAL